ncbi:hypothetical protein L3081_21790 [Colwellia sp. MSW7]|uniref:DUF7939 domain-containing protein n=1 Tax=Colwellia maritima TaxID=2912588 RepID=A0ABS9X5M8_9GAMM|nr:hypothetical protein [Colwellia maritima]MCI2285543.1 hypothetical protein [Colwellia maritima]
MWLLTLLAWALHIVILKRTGIAKPKQKANKNINNHYLALMAACKQNNAEQSLNLILPWLNNSTLRLTNKEISTLSEAILHIDNEAFTKAINEVQQHLYAKNADNSPWSGVDLLKAIQAVNASGVTKNNSLNVTLNPS